MRKTFADEISKYDVTIVTADLGYKWLDNRPNVINCGASEQAMLGIGIGYALEKKKVVCHSITPFLLYRPFEWLRYIDRHKIPIILAGSGRRDDYKHDGESHHCFDDFDIMYQLKNFECHWPTTKESIPELVSKIIESEKPVYINLTR